MKNKKHLSLILVIMILIISVFGTALCAEAASSVRVEKGRYTRVCYTGGKSRIKITNDTNTNLDVLMKNKNGRKVWQENRAIKTGQSSRTFYCGKNVHSIWIKVSDRNWWEIFPTFRGKYASVRWY